MWFPEELSIITQLYIAENSWEYHTCRRAVCGACFAVKLNGQDGQRPWPSWFRAKMDVT